MSILIQQERVYLGDELDKLYAAKAVTRKQKIGKYLLRLFNCITLGFFYEKLG